MKQAGFTLMETLVAFSVFSMASVALLEVYARANETRIIADANSHLARRAASLLAEAELMAAHDPLSQGADADGTSWRVEMTAVSARLVELEIHLTSPSGREAVFRTLRSREELGLEDGA